jgi:predicted ferric reductase
MALAVSNSKALWYLTRGTGVVTLLLLTTAVVLGIVTSVRWSSPRWPRFVLEWLHRNVSLVVLLFLAVHVTTAVIDAFAPLRWLDAVVPFSSGYRPLWVGFGTIALDLLVAVAVTSLLRIRIGYRAWRAVHWASYACWPLAVLHGTGTGSDTAQTWMLVIDALAVALVAVAVFWRASVGWPSHAGARLAAFASAIGVPIALAAWVVVGPLQPGWARTAGTPTHLLGSQVARP